MALASGANLGPYEIKCLLGAGGMGDIVPATSAWNTTATWFR